MRLQIDWSDIWRFEFPEIKKFLALIAWTHVCIYVHAYALQKLVILYVTEQNWQFLELHMYNS